MDPGAVRRLKTLLGSWREERGPSGVTVTSSRLHPLGIVEELLIQPEGAEGIPATLCRPRHAEGRCPAVLYAHAHGDRYDIGRRELVEGRPALADPPYGPLLAGRGFVVLCLDMPTFGDRAATVETALTKARHWYGATVFGDMLSELALGLDVLCTREDVDAARIAAFGVSMGATHAFWLAAIDSRIAAVAHLCVFASLRELVTSGAHDRHGFYMTVPGLLREFDAGIVAGLVAPRPQLVGVGLADPLTPPFAFERAWSEMHAAYENEGAADRLLRVVEPKSGHVETPAMRAAVLDFLQRQLREESRDGPGGR